jgi:hypothetical protein
MGHEADGRRVSQLEVLEREPEDVDDERRRVVGRSAAGHQQHAATNYVYYCKDGSDQAWTELGNRSGDGIVLFGSLAEGSYLFAAQSDVGGAKSLLSDATRYYVGGSTRTLDHRVWLDCAAALEAVAAVQPLFLDREECRVLDIVKGMKLINIELKERSLAGEGLEDKVVWAVQSRGLGPQVVLSSFNPLAIRRVKQLNPHLRTGLLYAPNQPLHLRRAWLRPLVRPDALHPHHAMITADYLRWARAHGYQVHTWTVDEPDEMRRLIALGVNSIITNQPDVLQKVLQV